MHRLQLLGGAALYSPDGRLVGGAASQPRRLAVLALLADAHPGVLTRGKVVGVLWPERPPHRARRSLTQALYVLRKEVGDAVIVASGADLRIDPGAIHVDLVDFRQAIAADDPRRAVELYEGPALDGFSPRDTKAFERWADGVRDAVAREFRTAVETLAGRAESEERYGDAVRWWSTLAREEPHDGRVVARLMAAHEAAGNPAAALSEADAYVARMRDGLGLEPSGEVTGLATRIREPSDIDVGMGVDDTGTGAVARDADEGDEGDEGGEGGEGGDDDADGTSARRFDGSAVDDGDVEPRPSHVAPARAWGRRAVTALVAATVSAAALLLGAPHSADERESPTDRSVREVVVLPFAAASASVPDGPEEIGERLARLVAANIDGARSLRYVPAPAGSDDTPRDPSSTSTTAERMRLASRAGAWGYLTGTIHEDGDELRIAAELGRVDGGGAIARTTVTGRADHLPAAADEILIGLAGAAYPGAEPMLQYPSARMTRSSAAFVGFLEGEVALRRGELDRAYASFTEAVRTDSAYGFAHYRRAVAAEWTHRSGAADRAIARALAPTSRIAASDRPLVEAFRAWRAGDARTADRRYRRILGEDPENVEAWFHLAEVAYHAGPLLGRSIDDARDAWRRVVELDPGNVTALTHLVRLEARAGAEDRTRALIERIEEIAADDALVATEAHVIGAYGTRGPTARERLEPVIDDLPPYSLSFLQGVVAGLLEDPEAARPIARRMTTEGGDDAVRAQGWISLAHLAMANGRWRDAWGHLDRAAEIAPVLAASVRAYLATLPFVSLPADTVRAVADALADTPPAPVAAPLYTALTVEQPAAPLVRDYLLALLGTRAETGEADDGGGDAVVSLPCPEAAAAHLAELCGDLELGLRAGAAAADSGRTEEALALIGRLGMTVPYQLAGRSAYFARSRERYLRAELLYRLDRLEVAEAWFAAAPHGARYDYVFLAPSHLRRGQIEERLGRPEAARRHYLRVLDLWSRPDAELAWIRREAESGLRRVSPPD